MQYKFFSIPAIGIDISFLEDELNSFLRGHRVLSVKRELVCDGMQSCWCICVEYLESQGSEHQDVNNWQKKERTDYREILSEEEFARFAKMRSVRKMIAEAEHIPAYAIMKDEQMAELAKLPNVDAPALKALQGFGEKKFERFGERFLTALREQKHETGGESVSED